MKNKVFKNTIHYKYRHTYIYVHYRKQYLQILAAFRSKMKSGTDFRLVRVKVSSKRSLDVPSVVLKYYLDKLVPRYLELELVLGIDYETSLYGIVDD